MPDTQQFEGSSIEEVLAQVKKTLGADAEIIEANRVRKGGLGGFFAKETFEVTAAPTSGSPARSQGQTSSSMGGATLPNGIDEAAFDRAAAHVRSAAGMSPTAAAGMSPSAAAGQASLLGLADQVSASEQTASFASAGTQNPSPAPRAGRTRAEQVAQQVVEEHLRAQQRIADAFEPLAPGDLPHMDTTATTGGEPPRLSTEGPAFNDVLKRMAADAGPEIAHAIDALHPPVAPPEAAPSAPESTASWIAARAEAMEAEVAAPGPLNTVEGTVMPVAPGHPPTHHAPTHDALGDHAPDKDALEVGTLDRTGRLLSWLERDNLPRTTLMTALRGLPTMPALPQTKGLVIAVVGERRQALQLCRQLAKACEADASSVVLASRTYTGKALPESQRIIDVTDASRERLSWRRREMPTFVAVECPTRLAGDAHVWTREIVDSLQAHRVIGVVTASRKVEDVRRWVEVVGGVDGLALEALEETATPYAVLALEIPVAFLGSAPATPTVWAQALMEGAPA